MDNQIYFGRSCEIKFSPTNINFFGVLSSRDIQIFELKKDAQNQS